MPEYAQYANTAEQRARLLAALMLVVPYAESRFEDLCEAAAVGPEDPDSPTAADVGRYVASAKALINDYAPKGWAPEPGDWVFYRCRETFTDEGLARVLSHDRESKTSELDREGYGRVTAHWEELKFLSRPSPAERGDQLHIALGKAGDSGSDTDYVLHVPESVERGSVWIKAGGTALCISKREDDLHVAAYPAGDEMSEPWAAMSVDDAFAPDAPSNKP